MFKKRVYGKEDKEKWSKVLITDMMSSEESDEENINCVKPLPWRSAIVEEFFYDLDEQYISGKSAQAKRQTKERIQGSVPSSRSPPAGMPRWALND